MYVYFTCFVISVYHSLAVEEKRRTSSVFVFLAISDENASKHLKSLKQVLWLFLLGQFSLCWH